MGLKIGKKAPVFDLPSTSGEIFSLKDHSNGPLVLYFYPKDFTSGCTKEACSFRDRWDIFQGLSVNVLGISADDMETHHRFRKKYDIPFHLLTDKDGTVSKLYNAWIPFINLPARRTYLLGPDLLIQGIFSSMFQAKKHVEYALGNYKL